MQQSEHRPTILEREQQAIEKFKLHQDERSPRKKHKPPPAPRERRDTKDETRKYGQMAAQLPLATKEETWFRHTNWQTKRARVREAMIKLRTPANTLDRFDQCGGDCMVEWSDDQERYRVRANYCKCRHCEPCQRAKANKIALNLRNRLEERTDTAYRFITLTLKHRPEPLRDQITRIYACFKKLRQYKCWQESQKGGAAMLEVKYSPLDFHNNKTDAPWHVHLHIISEGTWMSQKELAAAWLAVTGDSFKADIRVVNSGKDAAHYVSKYVTKGTNDDVWSTPDAAAEWIEATKGVRCAGTFGNWRGFKLLENPKDEGEWRAIGTLSKIVHDAQRGIPYAVAILRNLKDNLQYDPHRKRKQKQNE